MKIITERPILSNATGNCCGMSSFDDVNAETFEYATATPSFSSVQDFRTRQKEDGKKFRKDYLLDVLDDRGTAKDTRRSRLNERREARQTARSKRKEARFIRNTNRKNKRNSKKLTLISTAGRENFLFPINRVRLGKKRYKDGIEETIRPKDQINVTAPNGETATVDKKEVAKAMGINPNTITQADVQRAITIVPQNVVRQQGTNVEVGQSINEPVLAITVPENNVETAFDGVHYITDDLQNTNEKEKDVKEEERGLTKTQKTILYTGVSVAVLLIGFIIYKQVTKNN